MNDLFILRRALALVAAAWTLLAAGLAGAAPYQPVELKPATNGSRFLFVLELSAAMKASDAANRQALFDLIFTGFDGQMRHGDSFGLWLFADELRAGEFPLQVWDEHNPLEVASRTTQFVRAQKYAGKGELEEVLSRMLQLSRVVRDVHLVLISTGEHPINGTPFDASLNEAAARLQPERKKQRKPLITLINVAGGKPISASVTLPGSFIQLPERPAPIVAATPPAPASNKVAAAAPTAAPNPTSAPNIEPRTSATLTVGTEPVSKTWTPLAPPAQRGVKVMEITTVSNAAATAKAAPAAPAPVPTPVAHAPVPEPETTPAAATPTPSATVAASETPQPVVPAVPAPSAPVSVSPATPTIPGAMPVHAREVSGAPATSAPAPASPPAQVAVMVTPPGLNPTWLLGMGALLLAACLVLLIVVLRRLRPPTQGSFISQSMDRR